jgi:hypothetical protein
MIISSEHLSEKELLLRLEEAHQAVEIDCFYKHYRDPDGCYKVMGLAIIEATQEVGVIYQKQYGSDGLKSITWIRPLSSWLEIIDDKNTPRFWKV